MCGGMRAGGSFMGRGVCVIMRGVMTQTDLPRILGCSTRYIREGREERTNRIVPETAALERADRMRELKSGLSAVVGDPCVGLRPFVCDGSPLDCRVFLVGINPATGMSGNFWDFWDDDSGFNREQWRERYVAERGNGDSKSRKVIERIVEAARPVSCLETNLFSAQAGRKDQLRDGEKSTAAFEFLLDKIDWARLIVVFSQGQGERKAVCRAMESAFWPLRSDPEPFGAFGGGEVLNWGNDIFVLFVRHYTRWKYKHACEFGEWLRKEGDV